MAFLLNSLGRRRGAMASTAWTLLALCAALATDRSVALGQDSPTEKGQSDQSAAESPAVESPAADLASAPSENEPSGAAESAKQAFDALQQQWVNLIGKLKELPQQRLDAAPADRLALDQQTASLRAEADALVGRIIDAAVEVYRADAEAYPNVNNQLLAIVQFFLLGDANGDGGDQYEKALAPIKEILEAGGGRQWPYLYVWGGVASYCSSEFELAQEYFAEAQANGELGPNPPNRNPRDPRTRIWEQAQQYQANLHVTSKAWQKEAQIRAAEAQADDLPRVKLTTTRGEIVIELFENEAPQAAANFVSLAKKGFYDGVVFHRVLPGFMAQGGDPTGSGSGGPGYCIRCECRQPNMRRHFRGSLSMAHAGPDTGGSQFFLTFVPTSFLDGKHTVFGRVIAGMDVAASFRRRDPESAKPSDPDQILKAEVLRDRGHAYDFARLPGR